MKPVCLHSRYLVCKSKTYETALFSTKLLTGLRRYQASLSSLHMVKLEEAGRKLNCHLVPVCSRYYSDLDHSSFLLSTYVKGRKSILSTYWYTRYINYVDNILLVIAYRRKHIYVDTICRSSFLTIKIDVRVTLKVHLLLQTFRCIIMAQIRN